MDNWKAVRATGQLKKRQAKKALFKSSKTSFGLTTKLLTLGLPGVSRAEED